MNTTTERMDYYLSKVISKNDPTVDEILCVNVPLHLYKRDCLTFGDFRESIHFDKDTGIKPHIVRLTGKEELSKQALYILIALISELNLDFNNSVFHFEILRAHDEIGLEFYRYI